MSCIGELAVLIMVGLLFAPVAITMAWRIYTGQPFGDTKYCDREGCYAHIGREHAECYNHRNT